MTKNFTTTRKKVRIEDIVPNKWNPNVQDEQLFKKEIESIKAHGFLDPILVREKDEIYEIVDGEHRYKACKELDYEEIIIESLGEISDGEAKVLTIKLNNLRGQDDILKRAAILKQLSEGQLQLLPFNKEEMEEEIKLLDFDFSQYENAEVPDEEKEESQQILKLAFNLDSQLKKLHNKSKNTKIRLLIEQYSDWFRVFKSNYE